MRQMALDRTRHHSREPIRKGEERGTHSKGSDNSSWREHHQE